MPSIIRTCHLRRYQVVEGNKDGRVFWLLQVSIYHLTPPIVGRLPQINLWLGSYIFADACLLGSWFWVKTEMLSWIYLFEACVFPALRAYCLVKFYNCLCRRLVHAYVGNTCGIDWPMGCFWLTNARLKKIVWLFDSLSMCPALRLNCNRIRSQDSVWSRLDPVEALWRWLNWILTNNCMLYWSK